MWSLLPLPAVALHYCLSVIFSHTLSSHSIGHFAIAFPFVWDASQPPSPPLGL